MPRTVSIGCQDFEVIQREGYFYIDKTHFIREWWDGGDIVTLITRPRRFGKTLTMSMAEKFFSLEYEGRGEELFGGLEIWEDEKYRNLQGTYPVISFSFANVKETSFKAASYQIRQLLMMEYGKYAFLCNHEKLSEAEKSCFKRMTSEVREEDAPYALYRLSNFLFRIYGKKVIILLDEYDTPMQEAYVYGYWKEIVEFMRSLFNATFKTNPYVERAVMTGITRVSKESMFSDLNNLEVVTVTSEKYEDSFGFTEKEVYAALDEFSLTGRREEVKLWYDGFVFGRRADIYNPWSIINYLDKKKAASYWVNTSSNSLAGKLIREGSTELKMVMEKLLQGETFRTFLDEQIVFNQLDEGDGAVWSLLLASGYLTAVYSGLNLECFEMEYELRLTNLEVRIMFLQLIKRWFGRCRMEQNAFLKSLLSDDLEGMNAYMNQVSAEMFSCFDTGKKPSAKAQPERFYHGFVLGLLAELQHRYVVSSNRESGLGRYDVMLEPKNEEDPAIIIEFKVVCAERKETLEDGVRSALGQIEERRYETNLLSKGISAERIRIYGFAFEGSTVLIGKA